MKIDINPFKIDFKIDFPFKIDFKIEFLFKIDFKIDFKREIDFPFKVYLLIDFKNNENRLKLVDILVDLKIDLEHY